MHTRLEEEYHSLVTKKYSRTLVSPLVITVYVNPTNSDLKDLFEEIQTENTKIKKRNDFISCRFLIHKDHIYVWNEEFLHSSMIRHLGLIFDTSNTELIKIEDAFLGIADIKKGRSRLEYVSTNQRVDCDFNYLMKLYGTIVNKYFSNVDDIEGDI